VDVRCNFCVLVHKLEIGAGPSRANSPSALPNPCQKRRTEP
jgi:hypothetical protein